MKIVVAVQDAAVQKTHGDRRVSARVCLGTSTLRGSPPPPVPRQHLLVHILDGLFSRFDQNGRMSFDQFEEKSRVG